VLAAFARRITDRCAYNGPRDEGRRDVGDVRLEARLTVQDAAPGGAVELRLNEGEHAFRLLVPAGGGRARLLDGDEVLREADFARPLKGRCATLALEHYDHRVVAWLDGERLFSSPYEYENGGPSRATQQAASQSSIGPRGGRPDGVLFGGAGVRATFDSIRIQRDVYYLREVEGRVGPAFYRMGPKSYFVLGDNSPESADSRAWPSPDVPAENILGKAFGIFWPVQDMARLSQGTGGPSGR
jgi:signal peptidase I